MKLRIYFRPSIAVLLLGVFAVLLWCLILVFGPGLRWLVLPFAFFYTLLLAISGWALWRIHVIEHWTRWDTSARLLILAPHEDDCDISAGGVGARNRRLGGVTRIVYLAPDKAPELAELRAAEARAAWREAGVGESDLLRLDLLPPLRQRDLPRLRRAATTLRSVIDDFKPDVIVVPMFEGGHIHHDMVAAIMRSIVTPNDTFQLFEAPEYSPCVSLNHTPHRIVALCARWLFGLVSYYGPPDGVDGRPVFKYRLERSELENKRLMLAAFSSQNASSLVATRSYPDRLVRSQGGLHQRASLGHIQSYTRFLVVLRRFLPAAIVDRIFPLQLGYLAREGAWAEWWDEWSSEVRDKKG